MTGDVNSPVAILDKELPNYPSYRVEAFELCDCCGARFAISFHQASTSLSDSAHSDELPRTLREMLAEDHGHDRKHKHFTEIWTVSTWRTAAR